MVQNPAPSIRADSSYSRGRPSKNCLKTKMAISSGTCGKITAQYVFSSPTAFSSWKTGTISTCGGIMMPPISSQNTRLRPGKRSRDKAYAAIDAKVMESATVTTEVNALARYQFQMSPPLRMVA